MSARKLLALALITAAAAVFAALAPPSPTPVQPPTPATEPPQHFGWIDDPDAVNEAAALMRWPRFCETPAFAAPDEGPEDVFLWDGCREATGDVLPARDQKSVGCCVAFAAASAIEYLLCV